MLVNPKIERSHSAVAYGVSRFGEFDLDLINELSVGLDNPLPDTQCFDACIDPKVVLLQVREKAYATYDAPHLPITFEIKPDKVVDFVQVDDGNVPEVIRFQTVESVIENPQLLSLRMAELLRIIPENELAQFGLQALHAAVISRG